MQLQQIAEKKIIILDGAMGTMIQRYKLQEEDFRGDRFKNSEKLLRGNNDLLCLTQPNIIREIHYAYLKAGADLIETNTFNAQRISLADYAMEDLAYEINLAAARIAREAVNQYQQEHPGEFKFVAGAVGPTNRTSSLSPDVNDPGYRAVTFDELVSAYKEQINGLLDGGVDALLIETIFDTLNAKAAVFAALDVYDERGLVADPFGKNNTAPYLMLSGTITDASGRTLSGQTAEAFFVSLSHTPMLSIGLNCALGADQLLQYVETLSDHAPCLVSAYPNAGLPNAMGHYDQTPEEMADRVTEYLERGIVNILGGCCGTTPDHIAAIARAAAAFSPRTISTISA